jgi:Ca2+-transporting ATPase
MTVVQGWAVPTLGVSGEACAVGEFFVGDERLDARTDSGIRTLLQGAIACNDAKLEERGDGATNGWNIIGDPTEGALVVAAAKCGLQQQEVARAAPRLEEIPFDSERKRMTTIHRNDGLVALRSGQLAGNADGLIAFVKGAPDVVVELCTHVLDGGAPIELKHALRATILEQNHEMASQALRVLAVACRPLERMPAELSPEVVERDLVFIGLLGMIDPPRPEVIDAIRVAKGAGLRTVMVTGDYKDTAEAIARDIGLRTANGLVLTGAEIDRLSDEELAARVNRIDAAAASPAHKTRIVDAFGVRHVVAMTGTASPIAAEGAPASAWQWVSLALTSPNRPPTWLLTTFTPASLRPLSRAGSSTPIFASSSTFCLRAMSARS